MPTTPTPQTSENLKRAFGQILRNAGLRNVVRTLADVDRLLDDGFVETFAFFISKQRFDSAFVPTFRAALVDQLEFEGWDDESIDRDLLSTEPEWDQPIKEYYASVFVKGITNAKSKKGGKR